MADHIRVFEEEAKEKGVLRWAWLLALLLLVATLAFVFLHRTVKSHAGTKVSSTGSSFRVSVGDAALLRMKAAS